MEVGVFSFAAKTVLFKEGTPAEKLYRITSGEVLCVKLVKDRLIPVMLAKKGDCIGESALVNGGKYSYSAITLGFTETDPVSSDVYQKEFKASPTWMGKLLRTMALRFDHTASLVAENRIIHPSVFDESQFTAAFENELKKLIF